ncbi:hypothetical protein [Dankookia sp. P2]|uniref:hypothetical protein n=1 Tax=Dankookia sp. P2 TaxID=3423955 RepID=UPI003D6699C7
MSGQRGIGGQLVQRAGIMVQDQQRRALASAAQAQLHPGDWMQAFLPGELVCHRPLSSGFPERKQPADTGVNAPSTFNAFGPDNELRRQALAGAAPHLAWVMEQCRRKRFGARQLRRRDPCRRRYRGLTPEEVPVLVRSLFSAGFDTTINGIGAAL